MRLVGSKPIRSNVTNANIFFARFVSLQICDDRSQQEFFAQMMSCVVPYEVIYISSLPYQFSIFKDMGG